MKKIISFVLLEILFVLFIIGCVNEVHGNINKNYVSNPSSLHSCKSIETLKDSKGRPHRVAVFAYAYGVCAVDLDANTYYR